MAGEDQTPEAGGGGILGRITEFFGRGTPDQGREGRPDQGQEQGPRAPELDKTQAALEELKKGVDAQVALEGLIDRVRLAFYQDLAEAGVPQAEYERHWKKVEAKIQGYVEAARQGLVEQLPEFQNLDTFINNLDNLAGLKDPDGFTALAKKLSAIPGLGFIYGILISWADEGKTKNNGRDTAIGGMIRRLAGVMAPEQAAEAAMAEVEARRAQAQAAPGTPEAAETQGLPREVFEFLDAAHVRIPRNNPQVRTDYDALRQKHNADQIKQYATAAAGGESAVGKIYGAARRQVGGFDKFPARLLDIRLQAFTATVVDDQIIKPIADGQNLTPEKIRKFLDAIDVTQVASIDTAKSHLS